MTEVDPVLRADARWQLTRKNRRQPAIPEVDAAHGFVVLSCGANAPRPGSGFERTPHRNQTQYESRFTFELR